MKSIGTVRIAEGVRALPHTGQVNTAPLAQATQALHHALAVPWLWLGLLALASVIALTVSFLVYVKYRNLYGSLVVCFVIGLPTVLTCLLHIPMPHAIATARLNYVSAKFDIPVNAISSPQWDVHDNQPGAFTVHTKTTTTSCILLGASLETAQLYCGADQNPTTFTASDFA